MTNLHTIFEILCIQNIWYPNIGYKIYIIYSGDLKIWLIASISNISDANIANKIGISKFIMSATFILPTLRIVYLQIKIKMIVSLDQFQF